MLANGVSLLWPKCCFDHVKDERGREGEKKEGIFIIHFPIDTKKLQTHTFSVQDLSCQPV